CRPADRAFVARHPTQARSSPAAIIRDACPGMSTDPGNSDAKDVEKRWRDPVALRQAVEYGIGVIALAAIAFAIFAVVDKGSVILASSVPAVLFGGGVGAFVKTYRVWKDGGTWVAWQGAGWFLLTLMLVCLSIPWSAAAFVSR